MLSSCWPMRTLKPPRRSQSGRAFKTADKVCIAAKRFIVESPVYEEFCDFFVGHARDIVVGDPMDRSTTMGPLARADLLDDLQRQIKTTLESGARAILGGRRIERPGNFFEPTILSDVRPGMAAFDEETFGPAAAIIHASGADAAVELANASPFGLGNSIWTRDLGRAEMIAAKLESGLVFINGMTASDPRLPFGGVKKSGYGRELGQFGMHEFANVQTVSVAASGPLQ